MENKIIVTHFVDLIIVFGPTHGIFMGMYLNTTLHNSIMQHIFGS